MLHETLRALLLPKNVIKDKEKLFVVPISFSSNYNLSYEYDITCFFLILILLTNINYVSCHIIKLKIIILYEKVCLF